ncbi:hypothetical protein GCM10023208_15500 [Erythrobacter westpacificensis]|uniref:TadE-like domain-containing protein n=1 Tax=Erythrobacter westpacificensis TaxID=1055231 RepID=A0ABP9KCR0_9SPHN|tara:strand:+ start:727 stop:1137 length:411 start_codon:yes stop_codon:yes gene_type:complete
MNFIQKLRRDQQGASTIEFALLAPAFLTLIFGTIEGSRIVWTKNTLDEVAFATARCMSVSLGCETETQQQDFAVDRAASYGIAIVAADVTATADADCNGFPDSSRITITHDFNSVMGGFMPSMAADLEADSCFPQL